MSTTETLTIRITGENKSLLAATRESVLSMNGVGVAAGKLDSGLKKNTQNWQNLARVVQDSPYGFNGIANNLTQLIPGVGALGFAFSALVAAVTFSTNGFGAWTGHASKATKATEDFTEAVNSAASSAAKDGLSLQAYLNIARDHTKSMDERNRALVEANKLYGDHGEKLTLVNIEIKKVIDATNGYTEALIKQAIAIKYSDQIADSFIRQRNALKQLKDEQAKLIILQTQDKQNKSTKDLENKSGEELLTLLGKTLYTESELVDQRKALTAASVPVMRAQAEYNKALEEFQGLMNESNEAQTKFGAKQKETEVKLSDLQKILKTLATELLKIDGLENAGIKGFEESKVARVQAYTKAIEDLAGIGLTSVNDKFKELIALRDAFFKSSGNTPFQAGNTIVGTRKNAPGITQAPQSVSTGQTPAQKAIELASATTKAKTAQDFFNESVKNTEQIMGVLGPEIDHVFDALLKGESIGATLGNVFKDLAIQIAKAAIKALIFQAILSTFTGGTSAALGAVGGKNSGGFFGSFKKLLGFADGGVVSGPKSGYPIMAHGTEAILNGGQLKNLVSNVAGSARMNTAGMGNNGMKELAAQISGLKSTMANSMQQQTGLVATTLLKGADLQIMINRAVQQTLRNY